MIYKIGNVSDLSKIPIVDDKVKEILYHFARVLTTEYGEGRNIDTDDGGYQYRKFWRLRWCYHCYYALYLYIFIAFAIFLRGHAGMLLETSTKMIRG